MSALDSQNQDPQGRKPNLNALLAEPDDSSDANKPNVFFKLGESLGVGSALESSAAGVKKFGDFTAKRVDKMMISNFKVVLKMIGAKLNAQLHDDPMPVALHAWINRLFASFWPELQKGVLDKLLLEKGWQFRGYRRQLKGNQANVPSGFAWFKSTLIYTQMPYDRSFWGLIRSPLFLAVKLIFLFPLYGVDSICVIMYWLAAYKYDEHQLVNFIIKSKALAFITAGLFSGAIGFIKLYLCATKWDIHGPGSCEEKGMNKTFWLEYFLFLVRTVLVWITFLAVYCLEDITKWKKRRDAERNRMAAIERRGLFSVKATRLILICTWLLSWYNMIAALHAADYFSAMRDFVSTARQDHFRDTSVKEALSNALQTRAELTLQPQWAAILIFVMLQLPCSFLLHIPQMKPTLAIGGACSASFVIVVVIRNLFVCIGQNNALVEDLDEVLANSTLLILGLFTLVVMLLLIRKQEEARVADIAAMERFATVMVNLDRDGDGEVSKAEFRVAFKTLFPNAKFEPVWKRIDQDGDGSLSMAELANHFGMGHLVEQAKTDKDKKDNSDDDLEDMFSVESKLDMTVEASALSNRAGGVISYFLILDLVAFFLVGNLVILPHILSADDSLEAQWRLRTSLYFSKELLGLLSLPFLVFQMPVVKDALTHTNQTGYDRAGKCVAMLNKAEKSKRYGIQQEQRKRRYELMKRGGEVPWGEAIELHWNAFLGFPQALDNVNLSYCIMFPAWFQLGKRKAKDPVKESQGESGSNSQVEATSSIKPANARETKITITSRDQSASKKELL